MEPCCWIDEQPTLDAAPNASSNKELKLRADASACIAHASMADVAWVSMPCRYAEHMPCTPASGAMMDCHNAARDGTIRWRHSAVT
jgi:hypothetical protein